jgi:predicted nucleic acid-binding Zn ribbon protein
MDVRVIYRTCPACGRRFGQPDDPGRKRRFCSDACKQAAYRARKRAHDQPASGRMPVAGSARSRPAASGTAPGPTGRAPCRDQPSRAVLRGVWWPPRAAHLPPRPGPVHDRARRRYDGLCAKAAPTGFPEEATACRAKAEQLRAKYGL